MALFPDGKTFIKLGPLSIQWYAVCIILGAFIAYLIGQYKFKKHGYNKEILSDYFFGVLITGVIGARIWYVIFMFNELYRDDLIDIIMFRKKWLGTGNVSYRCDCWKSYRSINGWCFGRNSRY